jgi:hypothetical protein
MAFLALTLAANPDPELLRMLILVNQKLDKLLGQDKDKHQNNTPLQNAPKPAQQAQSLRTKAQILKLDAQRLIDNNDCLGAISILEQLVCELEQQSALDMKILRIDCLTMLGVAYREVDPQNPEYIEQSVNALVHADTALRTLSKEPSKELSLLQRERTMLILLHAGISYAKAFKAQGNVSHLLRACQCFAHILSTNPTSQTLNEYQTKARQCCEDFGIALEWCQKQQELTLKEISNLYGSNEQPVKRTRTPIARP